MYDELRRVTDMCEPPGLLRFGDLREKAVDVVQGLLRGAYTPTIEQVDRLVEFELSHINTLHPDFIGETREKSFGERGEELHGIW